MTKYRANGADVCTVDLLPSLFTETGEEEAGQWRITCVVSIEWKQRHDESFVHCSSSNDTIPLAAPVPKTSACSLRNLVHEYSKRISKKFLHQTSHTSPDSYHILLFYNISRTSQLTVAFVSLYVGCKVINCHRLSVIR